MKTQTIVKRKETTAFHHTNGGGATTFAELIDKYDYPQPERGQIMDGEVMMIADDRLVVDVGAKREAVVPHDEWVELDDTLVADISVGDEVPVWVTRAPVGEEELLVSLRRGLEQQDWERAREMIDDDELIVAPITGHNKGGILVQFGRIQGFVPNSHIPELRYIHEKEKRVSYKSKQVDEEITLKLIEVDQRQRRLVLSQREAQKIESRRQLAELEEGQQVKGRVAHIKEYGAFIDVGAVTGLLHVSEVDHQFVDHPSDILSVGDEVAVEIQQIDEERGRLSFSRKAMLPDPWDRVASDLRVRQLVEGTVTAVRDFGVFVSLPMGVEGLVHVSELHSGAKADPKASFQPGDEVLARVLDINLNEEQIGLSFRRVSAQEEIDWMSRKRADAANDAAD